MKSAILIIFLLNIVFTIQHHHHHHHKFHHHRLVHMLKSKENFLGKMNENIQDIMNKLFEAFNLTDNFIERPKTNLILTMLYDLNNIAENNFDLYDTLKNVSKVEANSKAINRIRLDEMVREIINENQSQMYNKTKDKNHEKNVIISTSTRAATQLTKHMLPMSEFKDSKEFKKFIGKFLGKINSLTVEDLFKKKRSNITEQSDNNLKVWESPPDLKAWYTNETNYRRIYRGKRTNIETFPFIASVHILQEFMCAANIIKKDLVITAASCVQIHYNNRFFRENPKTIFVRIGSDWAARRGEIVRVLEIYFHPSYDPKTLRNNIAILRLGRTIKFQARRRAKVRRIRIDHFQGNLPSNVNEVVILGWGATKRNQIVNYFEKLQVAFLEIYPIEECRKIYSKEYVTENNFCAGFLSKGSGACNRDVGGPGLVGGNLAGVVSFGPPVCGGTNAPTVFTRVGNYMDWIETIMDTLPPRYGAPKTTRMTSRAFIYYYNTLTARTYPIMDPVQKITPIITPVALRAQPEVPEEKVLTEIITDLGDQNNSLVYDIINEAFTEDFSDTTIAATMKNDIVNSMTSKRMFYSRPGVAYETEAPVTKDYDAVIERTTATAQTMETTPSITGKSVPKLITTPHTNMPSAFTRAFAYDVYDHNNYEAMSREALKPNHDYAMKDSDASRLEYMERQGVADYRSEGSKESNPNDFTQVFESKRPIFIDWTPSAPPVIHNGDKEAELAYELQ